VLLFLLLCLHQQNVKCSWSIGAISRRLPEAFEYSWSIGRYSRSLREKSRSFGPSWSSQQTSRRLTEFEKVLLEHLGDIGIVLDAFGALTKPPGDSQRIRWYSGSLQKKWV
jgi:hypothetical protein